MDYPLKSCTLSVLGGWVGLVVAWLVTGTAVNDKGDLLDSLNANPLFDLNNALNTYYEDDNENPNLVDIFDSKYYDCNMFIKKFKLPNSS
jgi:hypothetical protein